MRPLSLSAFEAASLASNVMIAWKAVTALSQGCLRAATLAENTSSIHIESSVEENNGEENGGMASVLSHPVCRRETRRGNGGTDLAMA